MQEKTFAVGATLAKQENLQDIVVIGDGPTCTGFRLAGIQKAFPVEDAEAEAMIEQKLNEEQTGILIINERFMEKLDWRLKKKIERIAKPVVIPIPDKDGAREQADSLNQMIKQALGFDLSNKK